MLAMTEAGTVTPTAERGEADQPSPPGEVSPWARGWALLPGRLRTVVVIGVGCGFGLLAAWSALAALNRPVYDRLADLHVYMGAVTAVRHGIPLYAYAAANGDPFTYPPFALLLFWPLGGLAEPVVQLLWTLATVAAVVVIAAALTARQRMRGRQRFLTVTLAAATVLLASAPVQSNLRFGQVSVFVVLLALLDAFELLPRRLGGALIGLAAAIKLTPLLFVPYLWVIGRRRDAVRALLTFAGCTGVAFLVWPTASVTFWTQAVFTTSRIGDLASTGNQSINGVLLRYAVPTTPRTLAWWALAGVVCLVAFLCARHYHQRGLVAHGAVIIGCATIAASPVSWTHHQIWTVLAGLLLVAGPRRARMIAGAIVLITMSLSLGAVLPLGALGPAGGFLRDNARAVCAVAVCCGGAVSLWQAAPGRVRLLPGLAVIGRPRTALVYCTLGAAIAATLLVSTHDRVVTAQAYTLANAHDPVWADQVDGDPCMGMAQTTATDGTPQFECTDAVGPAMAGLQLNYGMSATGPDDRGAIIVGQVGPEVTRLVYYPVQGAAPITVPLLPLLPAPASVPASRYGISSGQAIVPVIDHRSRTTRRFAVASNDTSDALLLAYNANGQVIGQGTDKLRNR